MLHRFRSRFDSAFAKTVPNLGPQDIEYGVVSSTPNEGVENLLCGLIGLVLNRKKNPEYAKAMTIHYTSRNDRLLIQGPGLGVDTLAEHWKSAYPHKRVNGLVHGPDAIRCLATRPSRT